MSQNQKIKSFKIEGVEIPLTILKNEVIDSLLAGNNLICNYSVEFEPEKPKSNVLFALEELVEGQEYYYISDNGAVYKSRWDSEFISVHKQRLNCNNVFLTKENAQKQADRNQLLADIKRFEVENNDVIDWSNSNQSKYYIFYTHVHNQWQIEFDWACRDLNKTYFSSETIATQALEKFKERLYILLD
jgi:hypothetical protein